MNKPIQTIFRAATKSSSYTIISNGLLQDTEISSKTRGLVCLLLSHPVTWQLEVKQLIKTYQEGRDAVYKMINEAIEHGYMGRFIIKDSRGFAEKHVYWVTDDPTHVPEMGLEKDEKITDLTGKKRREQRLNAQLPENPEIGGEIQLTNFPEVSTKNPTSWKPTSGKSGSDTLYKKINIKAAAAAFKYATLAVEEFWRLQPNCGFRKLLEVTPDRLEALTVCMTALGGGEENVEHGFARWCDLLERASKDPWFRGEMEPAKGYSRPYALSLDDMTNFKILERLMDLPIRFGPADDRWSAWKIWATANEKSLARIMQKIEDGKLQATDWKFPTSLPTEAVQT